MVHSDNGATQVEDLWAAVVMRELQSMTDVQANTSLQAIDVYQPAANPNTHSIHSIVSLPTSFMNTEHLPGVWWLKSI